MFLKPEPRELRLAMAAPWATILAAILLVASMAWPLSRLGSEFMPDLDEGDLLYMPSLLQHLDRQGARGAAADRPADQDGA